MFNRINAHTLDELLLPMSRRSAGKGVFFVRVCGMNGEVRQILWKYHEAARMKGVIIEGQIANPDERQLSFFAEMAGTGFEATPAFLDTVLRKWMPRMSPAIRAEFIQALCARFDELRRAGKNDSILRNIYTKMMCWLYYRFERLIPFLGQDDPPRILYEMHALTMHELLLLRILSSLGADVLLLEPEGDQPYLKQDAASQYSQLLAADGAPLARDFTLKQFRKEMAAQPAGSPRPAPQPPLRPAPAPAGAARPGAPVPPREQRPAMQPSASAPQTAARPVPQPRDPEAYFPKPERHACTNAWMKEAAFTEILTPIASRGEDVKAFCNAFIRIKGVPDKLTFVPELFRFYQQLRTTGRNIVIVDEELPLPGPEETAKIRRHPYRTEEELIIDLAGNLPACANVDLQRLMQQAFVRTMKAAAAQEPNLNRLVTSAVYLLCWIARYQSGLFQGYKGNEVPCFILMGGCRNQHDALYLRYLSRLPVDVLIVACDLNRICTLTDERLLELTGENSLPVMRFPRDSGTMQVRTVASSAEQDLTSLLYTDTGLYRNRQFSTAEAITLHTTYDEIFILWEQELKYRSSFSTENQVVQMPVVYAKVAGIENGRVDAYWQKIKLLLGDGTRLVQSFPFTTGGTGNPFQALAVKAVRNGKLKRDEVRAHRQYPFSLLREELQEHIFDKLQLMLDRRLIKGTFVNGTEYTIVATVLNMEKELVRMLQSFDFTRKNPKLVAICTTEQVCTLEDTILLTFLNLIGFDIVLFVPTGYQTVERYLSDCFPVEHQIGDYMYDLRVPDFSTITVPKGRSWLDNLLRRGN